MALIAEYAFDEGSGSTALATVGPDLVVSSSAWSTAGHTLGGVIGPSMTDQFVADDFTDLTFMFWANLPSSTSAMTLIHIDDGANTVGIWRYQNNMIGTSFTNDTPELITTAVANITGWHHYALTIAANGTAKLFIDGVERTSGSGAAMVSPASVDFGHNSAGNDTSAGAVFDDLRFFNTVLNATDITTYMNTPVVTAEGEPEPEPPGWEPHSDPRFLTSIYRRIPRDQYGQPWMCSGITAWTVTANLVPSEFIEYLTLSRNAGFNMLAISPSAPWAGDAASYNTVDNVPFFTGGNFTTPNEAYWSRVDDFMDLCEEGGFTVFFAYCDSDMDAQLYAAGSSVWQSYGTFLANRYANRPNIVWQNWFDSGGHDEMYVAIIQKINAVNPNALHTFHQPQTDVNNPTLGSENANVAQYMSIDAVYFYESTYRAFERPEAIATPLPLLFYEGLYENGTSNQSGGANGTRQVIRRQTGWALASGSIGDLYGSQVSFWPEHFVGSAWPDQLITAAAVDTVEMRTAVKKYDWWKLRVTPSFITSGLGTDALSPATSTRAAASVATNGGFALVYMPTSRAITVNTTMLGSNLVAEKIDPTTGVATPVTITSGSIAAPGTNAGGDTDWLIAFTSNPITPDAYGAIVTKLYPDDGVFPGEDTFTEVPGIFGEGTLSLSGKVNTSYSGSLGLSGSGSQTRTRGPVSARGSIARTGSGTQTHTRGAITASGSIALSGSGTQNRSGSATIVASGSISLSGSGTQTRAVGLVTASGSRALTGSGLLTFSASSTTSSSLDLGGSGLQTRTTSAMTTAGSVGLAGSGQQSRVVSVITAVGVLDLSGSGQQSRDTSAEISRSIDFSGAGALSATHGPVTVSGTLTPSGSGSLSADEHVAVSAIHELTGSGHLTVSGTAVAGNALFIGGVGSLDASSSDVTVSGSRSFTGAGSLGLSGEGSQQGSGSLSLAGSGTLSLSGRVEINGSVSTSGTGLLGLEGKIHTSSGLFRTGSGTLTLVGEGSVDEGGTLTLTGSGSLSFSGTSTAAGQLSLTGVGSLVRQLVDLVLSGELDLSGEGNLALARRGAVDIPSVVTLTALPYTIELVAQSSDYHAVVPLDEEGDRLMLIVKHGDTHEVSWKTNLDLTGATVRMFFRRKPYRSGEPSYAAVEVDSYVVNAVDGVIGHALSGDLVVADYDVEVEVVIDGQTITAPNDDYELLRVEKDLA